MSAVHSLLIPDCIDWMAIPWAECRGMVHMCMWLSWQCDVMWTGRKEAEAESVGFHDTRTNSSHSLASGFA